jgi:hypothetical protein
MKKPVSEKTVKTLNEIDTSLTAQEQEALRRHMEQLDPQLRKKASGVTMQGNELNALKSFDSKLTSDDIEQVRRHLEKLDPALKAKISAVITRRPDGQKKS